MNLHLYGRVQLDSSSLCAALAEVALLELGLHFQDDLVTWLGNQ